ncbi:glycosyltransferase family 39 protein [bacterium]|nr:glycosyltransferase family 39 protein [candidate division CSSED10-310 bacterium]
MKHLDIKSRFNLFATVLIVTSMCTACLIFSISINNHYLKRIPHVQDSVNYLFQASLFAQGKLYEKSSELTPFFAVELLRYKHGKMHSHAPFFYPFVLMFGVLAGKPWIVNPIVASMTLLLVYITGVRHYNKLVGILAAILMLFSPFFLIMSATFMSHAVGCFLSISILLFLLEYTTFGKMKHALILAALCGLLFNTRPLTGVMMVLGSAICMLFPDKSARRKKYRDIMIVLAIFLVFFLLFILYQGVFSGQFLIFTFGSDHTTKMGSSGESGGYEIIALFQKFGLLQKGWQTLPYGIASVKDQIGLYFTYVLNWPKWMNFAFFFIPFILLRRTRNDMIPFVLFVMVILGYTLYYKPAIMYGPRYLYETIPFFIILTARGIDRLSGFIRSLSLTRLFRKSSGMGIASWLTRAILFGFVFLMIYRNVDQFFIRQICDRKTMGHVYGMPGCLAELKDFNNIKPVISDTVNAKGITNALVFVHPEFEHLRWHALGSVSYLNRMDFQTDVIYANDLGDEKNRELIKQFPGRHVFIAGYPSGNLTELSREGKKLE